jgi:hypothetical protein
MYFASKNMKRGTEKGGRCKKRKEGQRKSDMGA